MNELPSRRQKKGNNPENTDNGEADRHGYSAYSFKKMPCQLRS